MKKAITSIILAVLKLLVTALVCYFLYDWNDLSKVFGTPINYNQWVAMVAIVNLFMPDIFNKSREKDDE